MKDGSNQLEIKGKNIVEVLSIELERMDRINSFYRVNSRVAIKRCHGSKSLFFAYLTDNLPVSFHRYSAL